MSTDNLEERFLRELAEEILAISKEPILLSTYSDSATNTEFTINQIVVALSETLSPVLAFLKNNEELLKCGLQSIQKHRELRERRAREPMKIHRNCIIEQV